jgi:nicotinate-nucleotide pyrophosphorylase
VNLVFTGKIRQNSFACPVQTGVNFFTGGWPMQQTPVQRALTVANGFSGTANPATSDRLLFWNGDTTPGSQAYQSHFLLNAGARQQWSPQADASLLDENHLFLFPALRSAILRATGPVPGWLMPLSWTP